MTIVAEVVGEGRWLGRERLCCCSLGMWLFVAVVAGFWDGQTGHEYGDVLYQAGKVCECGWAWVFCSVSS